MLPNYLRAKLSTIGINSALELSQYDYLQVFKWLKGKYPSLSFHGLFDLYCVSKALPLNSLTKTEQQALIRAYKQLLPSYLPLTASQLNYYLTEAEAQAKIAFNRGEIPIGAVIVKDDTIIARGYNQTILKQDITQHAEIVALQEAQKVVANYRLNECDLYVTLEPCAMCIGAILNSRMRRVVFGGLEPKTGAVLSQYKLLTNRALNHHTEAIGPINTPHFATLLQQFLASKR
jgi:tRNA(adenine34) deaminase